MTAKLLLLRLLKKTIKSRVMCNIDTMSVAIVRNFKEKQILILIPYVQNGSIGLKRDLLVPFFNVMKYELLLLIRSETTFFMLLNLSFVSFDHSNNQTYPSSRAQYLIITYHCQFLKIFEFKRKRTRLLTWNSYFDLDQIS